MNVGFSYFEVRFKFSIKSKRILVLRHGPTIEWVMPLQFIEHKSITCDNIR